MNTDHGPETVMINDDPMRWASTRVEDVFDPSIRVVLSWQDVEEAAKRGAVVPAQAYALWASWALPSSPQRINAAAHVVRVAPTTATFMTDAPLESAQQPGASISGRMVFGLAFALLVGVLLGAGLSYLILAV